ncbi:MAG: hypothetical protein R3243_12340 [Arenibacter latericius]|nr:hypothetical protein [Arenibacter latericius]
MFGRQIIKYQWCYWFPILTSNSELYNDLEDYLANFYRSESALVLNSGYDANIDFFSGAPKWNYKVME